LLILGYRPYQQIDYTISSEPNNCIIASSNKGFALQPGTFHVTINKELHYTATHNKDSLRITERPNQAATLTRPEVILLGCSYTYGMGINDQETFAFLIQDSLKHNNVINFGVPGYGNVQSYLQLKDYVAQGNHPTLAIINFADFHIERNALSLSFRRNLHMGFQRSNSNMDAFDQQARIPYVREFQNGFNVKYERWDALYKNWKGRERFATINLFQNVTESRKERKSKNEVATLFLFGEIQSFCDQHNIELIVTGLTKHIKTEMILQSLNEMNIQTRDISVDLNLGQYNNLPFDSHPNALAHAHYANALIDVINQSSIVE